MEVTHIWILTDVVSYQYSVINFTTASRLDIEKVGRFYIGDIITDLTY